MKFFRRIQYNSPVVLTFSLVSLLVLVLDKVTGGWVTTNLFSVYRSSLAHVLTYPRFFLHVLGHAGYEHFLGNILLFLAIGPSVEEKYGSRNMIIAIAITALISGLVQFIFFPGTALLGASGIVFMVIVMSSLGGMKSGRIPLTLIFVLIFYIGGEIAEGVSVKDNISQITHVIGGLCGAVIGWRIVSHRRI